MFLELATSYCLHRMFNRLSKIFQVIFFDPASPTSHQWVCKHLYASHLSHHLCNKSYSLCKYAVRLYYLKDMHFTEWLLSLKKHHPYISIFVHLSVNSIKWCGFSGFSYFYIKEETILWWVDSSWFGLIRMKFFIWTILNFKCVQNAPQIAIFALNWFE